MNTGTALEDMPDGGSAAAARGTATIHSAESYPLVPCCLPNGTMRYLCW